jgi:hypothetical protein
MSFHEIPLFKVGKLTGDQIPQRSESEEGIPLAPLVTSRCYPDGTILTRVTLLIPAAAAAPELEDGYPQLLGGTFLDYRFQYDLPNDPVTDISLYYGEFVFKAPEESGSRVSMVQVKLHQHDPVTSRGTVTTIQES